MDIFNIVIYIATSVVVFLIAKLLWYLFKLVVFKIIIDNFVEFIILEEDDNNKDYKIKNKPSSDKQDHLEKNKIKELEMVSVERIIKEQERAEDMAVDGAQKTSSPRVVGVKVQVYGKFTKMFADKIGLNLQQIDQKTLLEKGYHQAMLEAKRGAQSISVDQQRSRGMSS